MGYPLNGAIASENNRFRKAETPNRTVRRKLAIKDNEFDALSRVSAKSSFSRGLSSVAPTTSSNYEKRDPILGLNCQTLKQVSMADADQ